MRRWQWMALAMMVLGGGAGAYWYFTPRPTTVLPPFVHDVPRIVDRGNGGAEESEVIEPLIVDRGKVAEAPVADPVDVGPMPRVLLEPGMEQPPRPDAGRVPRMPYADEEDILGLSRRPVEMILEQPRERSRILDEIEKANAAEESESKVVTPPVVPIRDYHYDHCPYHGGCPAPYYYRPIPRD